MNPGNHAWYATVALQPFAVAAGAACRWTFVLAVVVAGIGCSRDRVEITARDPSSSLPGKADCASGDQASCDRLYDLWISRDFPAHEVKVQQPSFPLASVCDVSGAQFPAACLDQKLIRSFSRDELQRVMGQLIKGCDRGVGSACATIAHISRNIVHAARHIIQEYDEKTAKLGDVAGVVGLKDQELSGEAREMLASECRADRGRSCDLLGIRTLVEGNTPGAINLFDKACSCGYQTGCFHSSDTTLFVVPEPDLPSIRKAEASLLASCLSRNGQACDAIGHWALRRSHLFDSRLTVSLFALETYGIACALGSRRGCRDRSSFAANVYGELQKGSSSNYENRTMWLLRGLDKEFSRQPGLLAQRDDPFDADRKDFVVLFPGEEAVRQTDSLTGDAEKSETYFEFGFGRSTAGDLIGTQSAAIVTTPYRLLSWNVEVEAFRLGGILPIGMSFRPVGARLKVGSKALQLHAGVTTGGYLIFNDRPTVSSGSSGSKEHKLPGKEGRPIVGGDARGVLMLRSRYLPDVRGAFRTNTGKTGFLEYSLFVETGAWGKLFTEHLGIGLGVNRRSGAPWASVIVDETSVLAVFRYYLEL